MSSLGTESTNFGNCSSPHTDSFGKSMGFHPEQSTHISNPPPSLITRRQSQVGMWGGVHCVHVCKGGTESQVGTWGAGGVQLCACL